MNRITVFCGIIFVLFNQTFGRSVLDTSNTKLEKPTDHAKVARELVHRMDWSAFGTIAIAEEIKGYPQLNVLSVADGPRKGKSTGNIYFYLTDLSAAAKNLKAKNVATMLFSNEQDLSCSKNGIDPMEPTCARTIMSGAVVKVQKDTEEYEFAKSSFIDRHPAGKIWSQVHDFVLYKFDIKNIIVLDWYGGSHNIPVEDYYKVNLQ